MKKLLFALVTLLSAPVANAETPQQILKKNGFVYITKQNGHDLYYRPREVKRHDGLVYYSVTTFFKSGADKNGLRSEYKAIACKEKRVLHIGTHNVPFIGKSSFKNYTTRGIKDSDFKPLSTLDKRMHYKLCK